MLSNHEYEKEIFKLRELISTADTNEEVFQDFFTRSKIGFTPIGYSHLIPHPHIRHPTRGDFVPDFVVKRPDGLWELLEIKRPDTKVIKSQSRRATWYAEMESYISQCHDYIECLTEDGVRKQFEQEYSLKLHPSCTITLVAGLTELVDTEKAHSLLTREAGQIKFIAFDEVFSQYQSWYFLNNPENGDRSSLTIAMLLQLESDEYGNGAIFDLGDSSYSSRITLRRARHGNISIEIINYWGLRLMQEFKISVLQAIKPIFVILHVYHLDDSSRIMLELNGFQLADYRFKSDDIASIQSLSAIVGNDWENSGSGGFRMNSFLFRYPSLSLFDRVELRQHFQMKQRELESNDGARITGVKFLKHQFLFTEGHPKFDSGNPAKSRNLIQTNLDNRPTAC